MKKIASTLCGVMLAGLLALPFVSCTNQEIVPTQEITELRFNVQVTNASAPDTKVLKTGWENGDKVYVFFNVSAGATTGHLNAAKYVTLTYNGTSWDGAMSGDLSDASELGTAGTMYVVYFPFGGVSIASDGASGVTFKTAGNADEDLNGQPIYTYYLSGNTSYTVETLGSVGTLDASVALQMPDVYVYFFVNKDGGQYNANEQYRLSAQGVIPTACSGYSAGTFSETTQYAGHTLWGYAYKDAGIAFSGKIDGTWASAADHRFYLYCKDGGALSKTFNKALASHESVNLGMSTGWIRNAYRGFEVSDGFLKRNTDGTYGLTPGSSPFEIYDYFGNDGSKNTVYFQGSFLKSASELGDGSSIDATSAKLPAGWKIPSAYASDSDWGRIIGGAPAQNIIVQKGDNSEVVVSGAGKGYSFVVITKGTQKYYGVLLLRDGSYLPKNGGLRYWGAGSDINSLSYDQYLVLKDAGCFFLSCTGCWTIDTWRYLDYNATIEGNYMSSTISGGTFYRVSITNSGSPSVAYNSGSDGSQYYPVRLVKAI